MVVMMAGCATVHHWTIASVRGVICDGESGNLLPGNLYKEDGKGKWHFTFPIEGFNFVEGYEYRIVLDEDLKFDHIESKVKKASEGVFSVASLRRIVGIQHTVRGAIQKNHRQISRGAGFPSRLYLPPALKSFLDKKLGKSLRGKKFLCNFAS